MKQYCYQYKVSHCYCLFGSFITCKLKRKQFNFRRRHFLIGDACTGKRKMFIGISVDFISVEYCHAQGSERH